MVDRLIPLDRVAPWLMGGASSVYVIARARRLSEARPSHAPLLEFVLSQSDIVLLLCGCQIAWYLAWRRRRAAAQMLAALAPGPIHQLRQVFTALLIGTRLLARKASHRRANEIVALSMRLHDIASDGARALITLDDLRLGELFDPVVLETWPVSKQNEQLQ